jgi:hypothetical protein
MTKRGGKFKDGLRRSTFLFWAPPSYESRMRYAVLIGILVLAGTPACRAQDDAATALCRTNPAYSIDVMRSVLEAQLQKDHDPALDAEPPAQMAAEAAEQGVKDCATDLRANTPIYQALSGLTASEQQVGWDAYNTACSDRSGSKADCIRAEVGAVRALKHMVATDQPPGAKTLVETCELVLQTDPAMSEWRECVDTALLVHADTGRVTQCKTSVAWHVAKTGAQAGAILKACLARAS